MTRPFIFLFALIPRLLVPNWLAGDSRDYLELAESIKNGAFALNGVPTTFRPPLYPAFLALFGEAAAVVQCILGALTCVLIYEISKSIWPAMLYAILPMAVYYTGGVLTETLFIFLIVLAVYLWLEERIYFAGFVFGLATLTRPIVLPVVLLALLISLVIKTYRRDVIMLVGISLLICAPWIIRNSLLDGKFTLTQKSALGTNLLYGTFTHQEFGPKIWDEALARDWGEALPAAVDRITDDPALYLRARYEQYPRLFIDTVDYVTEIFLLRLLLVLAQCVLLALAVWGVSDQPLPLWITPLFLILFHIPLWVETRYFLPAMPFVCIFAVNGARRLAYGPSRFDPSLRVHTHSTLVIGDEE